MRSVPCSVMNQQKNTRGENVPLRLEVKKKTGSWYLFGVPFFMGVPPDPNSGFTLLDPSTNSGSGWGGGGGGGKHNKYCSKYMGKFKCSVHSKVRVIDFPSVLFGYEGHSYTHPAEGFLGQI